MQVISDIILGGKLSCAIIVALTAACYKERIDAAHSTGYQGEFSGTLHTGEYSYFENYDGSIYVLKYHDSEYRLKIASILKKYRVFHAACLRMKFNGEISNEKDQTSRNIVYVVQGHELDEVPCADED